jgi:hypothetical protein
MVLQNAGYVSTRLHGITSQTTIISHFLLLPVACNQFSYSGDNHVTAIAPAYLKARLTRTDCKAVGRSPHTLVAGVVKVLKDRPVNETHDYRHYVLYCYSFQHRTNRSLAPMLRVFFIYLFMYPASEKDEGTVHDEDMSYSWPIEPTTSTKSTRLRTCLK